MIDVNGVISSAKTPDRIHQQATTRDAERATHRPAGPGEAERHHRPKPSAVSSNGHSGAGGEKGGKLDVLA
ncbi:MAG: hypothetical protein KBD01_17575 [Acidobacteria bacterium]|nr:hypothetical protein [Acidobacteriota bacterium]